MIISLGTCLIPECPSDHKWEFEYLSAQELVRVQEVLGLAPDEFQDALNEGMSTMALRASILLVNILHRRHGVKVAFDDTDFDLQTLAFTGDPAADGEEPGEPEAGEGKDPAPTSPS